MSNSRAGKGRSSSDKVPKTCCLKVNFWPISKSEEARLYEQENERRALAHAEDVETVEAEHESAASTSSPEPPTPVAELMIDTYVDDMQTEVMLPREETNTSTATKHAVDDLACHCTGALAYAFPLDTMVSGEDKVFAGAERRAKSVLQGSETGGEAFQLSHRAERLSDRVNISLCP